MKDERIFTYVVLILLFIVSLIYVIDSERLKYQAHLYKAVADRHIAEQREALDRVPTFKQLQVMVGAEPDGIIGPNTIAKWDKKICDQCAIESIERMAKGDKK